MSKIRRASDGTDRSVGALEPGVAAENVHAAYAGVIQGAGYEYRFRCGRATGFGFLEAPQLVTGSTTIIQPGMVLAVDGSVSVETYRAQVGDSFFITVTSGELLTDHPKPVEGVILQRSAFLDGAFFLQWSERSKELGL